jgi:hypothetical protein
MALSYSRFLADATGEVRAVTIDPAGQVIGRLASGREFATTIPVALDDRALAGQLCRPQPTSRSPASPQQPGSPAKISAATCGQRSLSAGHTRWHGGHQILVMRVHLPAPDDGFHGPSARLVRDPGPPRATLLSAFPALVPQRHGADTVFTGLLDRSALYGVLAEAEALGLDLVEVRQLTPHSIHQNQAKAAHRDER